MINCHNKRRFSALQLVNKRVINRACPTKLNRRFSISDYCSDVKLSIPVAWGIGKLLDDAYLQILLYSALLRHVVLLHSRSQVINCVKQRNDKVKHVTFQETPVDIVHHSNYVELGQNECLPDPNFWIVWFSRYFCTSFFKGENYWTSGDYIWIHMYVGYFREELFRLCAFLVYDFLWLVWPVDTLKTENEREFQVELYILKSLNHFFVSAGYINSHFRRVKNYNQKTNI